MPDGLTAEQLEVAAFVEEYLSAFNLAVERRDADVLRRLQDPECECVEAADLAQQVIDLGGQLEQGGVTRVDRVTEIFLDEQVGEAQVLYDQVQEEGRFRLADGTYSQVPRRESTRLFAAQRSDEEWRVVGIVTTSDDDE